MVPFHRPHTRHITKRSDVSLETVKSAREKGLTISCDLNHRAKLWKYGKTAGEVMAGLMPYVDVAIGNEEDCEKIFNDDIVRLEFEIKNTSQPFSNRS